MLTIWNRPNTTLSAALGVHHFPKPVVVTVIGSGGKTTLLHVLADECRAAHQTTLLTTTTHMFREDGVDLSVNYKTISQKLCCDGFCFAGMPASNCKVASLPIDCFHQLVLDCDIVLVEGDGSRRFPLKLHGEGEPVLPSETTIVVRVCGMSSLGQRFDSVCHRWTQSGISGEKVVDLPLFAEILQQDRLILPPDVSIFTVFHQADTPELAAAAEEIAKMLHLTAYLVTTTQKSANLT